MPTFFEFILDFWVLWAFAYFIGIMSAVEAFKETKWVGSYYDSSRYLKTLDSEPIHYWFALIWPVFALWWTIKMIAYAFWEIVKILSFMFTGK